MKSFCFWYYEEMDKPIISVKEARKLLGKDAKELNDQEIEKLISDLQFLARYTINQFRSSGTASVNKNR